MKGRIIMNTMNLQQITNQINSLNTYIALFALSLLLIGVCVMQSSNDKKWDKLLNKFGEVIAFYTLIVTAVTFLYDAISYGHELIIMYAISCTGLAFTVYLFLWIAKQRRIAEIRKECE